MLLIPSLFISARTMRSIFRAVWIIVFVSFLHSCEKKDRDNGTTQAMFSLSGQG